MPKKQNAANYIAEEIELLPLPTHSSYFQHHTPVNMETETAPPPPQGTPDDAEPGWELLPEPDGAEYGPDTPPGSGAAQTPAASEQPSPMQLAAAYLEPVSDFLSSANRAFWSATDDFSNEHPYPSRMTDLYLQQSTAGMPYGMAVTFRALAEVAYLTLQRGSQLPGLAYAATATHAASPTALLFPPAASGPASVHLNETPVPATSDQIQAAMYQAFLQASYPNLDMIDCDEDEPLDASQAAKDADDPGIDTSSMPPQHSAPAPASVGPASQDPFADKSDESPTDEEQDEEESEDSEDSQEYQDCEGASDSDNADDPGGPAGSGGSAGTDGSKDSGGNDSAGDANTPDKDAAPSSPEQAPPGNQLALKDGTIPVAFLQAAPDLHSEHDAAVPGDGPATSTAVLAVGLAALTAYLIGTEMPDWSASDCHLVGQPLNLLAGLMV